MCRGYGDILRICTLYNIVTQVVTDLRSIYPSCQTQDLVSNRPSCDPRSDIGDDSWKLNAKNWRNIGRKDISPLALQYIHAVEAKGSHLATVISATRLARNQKPAQMRATGIPGPKLLESQLEASQPPQCRGSLLHRTHLRLELPSSWWCLIFLIPNDCWLTDRWPIVSWLRSVLVVAGHMSTI